MAPLNATTIPLLALLLSSTAAFIAPTSSSALQRQRPSYTPTSSSTTSTAWQSASRPTSSMRMVNNEVAEEKAARLRETAASFRAQAAELENSRERERRMNADRSFNNFDSNRDGAVDAAELKAGLESPLRRSFTKQLTARMGRKPTPEEVDARIAQLPGGSLFPDDLARKLIEMYDDNGDGLLQKSEFAPTEELRMKLENLFRERQEEERQARVEERQRLLEEKVKADTAVVSVGGANDSPATSADKALSALAYILPLADSMVFAGHLFNVFPEQTAWVQPIAAALLILRSVLFATLAGFFGLSFLSRNPEVNKLVRFNMQQAINLDIALFLPSWLGALAALALGQDAYKLLPISQAGSDVIFVTMLLAVAYSIGVSATGAFPNKLPIIGRLNRENPERMKSGNSCFTLKQSAESHPSAFDVWFLFDWALPCQILRCK
ncbi:unnamed protein product [Ascophyllum nodosum]